MGSSSVGTTGNALVAAIAGMTDSSKNKLRDVARKATLARLLDDGSSASSTNNDGGHTTDKENSSRGSAVGRGLSSSNTGHVFSERSNINNKHNDNSTSSTGAAGTHTNHVNLEALRNLRDLCSIVSEVERRMAVLRDTIDSHRRDNAARREMSEITRQQTAQLAATLAALPEHLPHAAPTKTAAAYGADATAATAAARSGASVAVSAPAYTRTGANRRGANPAAVGGSAGGGGMTGRVSASDLPGVPVLELVTVAELNGVPRSTRARLTIEQINGAVAEIQKAVERRCVSVRPTGDGVGYGA